MLSAFVATPHSTTRASSNGTSARWWGSSSWMAESMVQKYGRLVGGLLYSDCLLLRFSWCGTLSAVLFFFFSSCSCSLYGRLSEHHSLCSLVLLPLVFYFFFLFFDLTADDCNAGRRFTSFFGAVLVRYKASFCFMPFPLLLAIVCLFFFLLDWWRVNYT